MKGFRFRLDPVLGVRRHELERERLGLADSERHLADARQRSVRASARVDGISADQARRAAGGLAAPLFAAGRAGLARSLAERRRARELERVASQRVLAQRQRVAEAHRAVRALEILREKALVRGRREGERREQRDLDEVAGRCRGPALALAEGERP